MSYDTPEDIINLPQLKFLTNPKLLPKLIGAVVLLILIFSSFYSVGTDEIAVVQRFGKYVRTTKPGLHFKLPIGIEKAANVKVEYVFKEELGFRTLRSGIKTEYSAREYFDESLMLTGDLNVLVVEWIVRYKVKDPIKLLFNIRNPRETIRGISEAVMRQIVGDNSVNEVLTVRRIEINQEVQDRLQEILDSYDCGIHVVTVKLQDVNPSDEVKSSFNEVNEAKQEKERMINQSWEAYNKVIPRAKGTSEKTIREAEGYALDRVNRAKGDAAKFLATWNAYKVAKEVTKKRLYLETMEKVLSKVKKKYIIDPEQKSILPLLRLEEK